ncbi:MAG: DUF1501 domain-containing protein, partial [Gemmataceae bacterium]
MFQVDLGQNPTPYCDGRSRRSFLQLGVAGLATLGLPQVLRAKSSSSSMNRRDGVSSKKTSVILIWLDGGPGHMDLYDMKPEAPAEYRGLWKPIRTKVPGFQITELFPKQAKQTDKFSIVRSLHHNTGDHFAAAHRMLTTKEMGVSGAATPGKFPFIGALASRELGPRKPGLPAHVAVPYASSVGLRPGYFGGNFAGNQHNPFETVADANSAKFQVPNLNLAGGLSIDKLDDRRGLLKTFDQRRAALDKHPALAS